MRNTIAKLKRSSWTRAALLTACLVSLVGFVYGDQLAGVLTLARSTTFKLGANPLIFDANSTGDVKFQDNGVDKMVFDDSGILTVTNAITASGGMATDALPGATATTLAIGNTTSTGVSVCNSAACDTLSLGTNADADTINIGDALDTLATAGTATHTGSLNVTDNFSVDTTGFTVQGDADAGRTTFAFTTAVTAGSGIDVSWAGATAGSGSLVGFNFNPANVTPGANDFSAFSIADIAAAGAGTHVGLDILGTNYDVSLRVADGLTVSAGAVSLPAGSIAGAALAAGGVGTAALADTVCLQVYSVEFNPTEASATQDFVSLVAVDVATGDASFSTTEGNEDQLRLPAAFVAHSLRAQVDVAPGAGNDPWAITLQDDAAGTTLTCTIDEAATTCEDLVNTPAIAALSLVNLLVSSAGGDADPTAAAVMRISFCLGQ